MSTKRTDTFKDMNTTVTGYSVANEYRIIAARHACGFPHEARAENAMRIVGQGLCASAMQTLKIKDLRYIFHE